MSAAQYLLYVSYGLQAMAVLFGSACMAMVALAIGHREWKFAIVNLLIAAGNAALFAWQGYMR